MVSSWLGSLRGTCLQLWVVDSSAYDHHPRMFDSSAYENHPRMFDSSSYDNHPQMFDSSAYDNQPRVFDSSAYMHLFALIAPSLHPSTRPCLVCCGWLAARRCCGAARDHVQNCWAEHILSCSRAVDARKKTCCCVFCSGVPFPSCFCVEDASYQLQPSVWR